MDQNWMALARCSDGNSGLVPIMFAHTCKGVCRTRKGCAHDPNTQMAKNVCHGCPVLMHCRFWSIATSLQFGVAGGLTLTERRKMKKRLIAAKFPLAKYAKRDTE